MKLVISITISLSALHAVDQVGQGVDPRCDFPALFLLALALPAGQVVLQVTPLFDQRFVPLEVEFLALLLFFT
jgi:hypothetical protein